jgi:hypothetical protein
VASGVASATVTLSGTATYDSVPNTSGSLNYPATTQKPVRGATVDVVNSTGGVVATTSTDESGSYSVAVPSNTQIIVRVMAQIVKGGSAPAWDVTVRDNTQSDAIYAMETPAFATGIDAVVRNVQAPSGWDGSRYGSRRVAAPFAVLDTIYSAQAKVLTAQANAVFPVLRVFWSSENLPASGNLALGQIGTTFFRNSASGRTIYVLGKENIDTDEYDASVVAHEWGHYYQSVFSRDDSPGGDHAPTDLLDRRVAFSEGWGNAWSGIALARSNYTDSVGASQAQGANVDLGTGPVSNPGWFREASIHSILWKLNGQVGFKAIHDTLSGPFKAGLAVTSIHPFIAAFNAAAPGSGAALVSLLGGQNISAAPNDPLGTSETNNGGVAGALPMYRPAAVGGNTSACVSNQAGQNNKLGNFAYLTFNAPTARTYTISVGGASAPGVDPDFIVYEGRQILVAEGTGASETASVALAAGDHVLVVNDFNNSSVCFTVSIQ